MANKDKNKKENETPVLVKQAVLGIGLSESIYKNSDGKFFAVANNIFAHSQLGGHTFNSLDSMEKAYKKQGINAVIQDCPNDGIIPGMG